MFALLSVAAISAGVVLAWIAHRHPDHSKTLEICAGISLFAGFGLLGASLWWMVA
jgi:apolipoprotein N-acyltransferase